MWYLLTQRFKNNRYLILTHAQLKGNMFPVSHRFLNILKTQNINVIRTDLKHRNLIIQVPDCNVGISIISRGADDRSAVDMLSKGYNKKSISFIYEFLPSVFNPSAGRRSLRSLETLK